jgi:hypothetical protein
VLADKQAPIALLSARGATRVDKIAHTSVIFRAAICR